MKKTYVFLAEGFEDIEALAVVDVLRRGGVEVKTVAVGKEGSAELEVCSAHGVEMKADMAFGEVVAEEAECLVFPGGLPGAANLAACSRLLELMQRQYDGGGWLAAICAAPALVLGKLEINGGKRLRMTCYPGFGEHLPACEVSADGVVVDGRVITGKGPGFAIPFALTLLEHLRSAEVAREVAQGMLLAE